MEELIDEAARLFDITRQELTGSSRTREVVLPAGRGVGAA